MNSGDRSPGEIGRGPTWRAWIVTLLAAITLSLAATLLLGGYDAFRAMSAPVGSAVECGRNCCGGGGSDAYEAP